MPFCCILRSQSMELLHTQNYRKLMLGCQKGKSGWETTEKGQRSAEKTGETKKRKSYKNWENIKREWEAGNIRHKREVSDQNGRVGISGISQSMTLCMLPKTETVGADLQSTALQLMMIMMTINGYLLNLEIDLVLEIFADTGQEVIECGVLLGASWHWGRFFHPAVVPQPLFRQTLLMLKLMWQFVLNRVWQIVRCMFMSGSNNREAAVLKDIMTRGKRSLVTRLVL